MTLAQEIRPAAHGHPSLRDVLRLVPTSVSIVCTLDDGDPVGHTVGSFSSISLDPPLVGYFAMRTSATLAAIRRHGAFSVNVLGDREADLARLYSRRPSERFASTRWAPGPRGCPHLAGAVAVIDCDVHQVLAVGDHDLVVGRVVDATTSVEKDPLIHVGSRFRQLTRAEPTRGQSTGVA